jgi:pimeloyl-ACP methyl ester carboxylesterase
VRLAGPCVILAHSQGAYFALRAALNAPGSVRALVLLEPAGAPDPVPAEAATLRGVPTLAVWGDFFAGNASWANYRTNAGRWFAAMRAAGGQVDEIDLPGLGVHGNSHMLMMDRNSDDIAARVQDWLAGRGLWR